MSSLPQREPFVDLVDIITCELVWFFGTTNEVIPGKTAKNQRLTSHKSGWT